MRKATTNSLKTSLIAAVLLVFCSCTGLYAAGVIAPELESTLQSMRTGEETSVVIELAGKADLSSLRDLKQKDKHVRRSMIAGALRQHAQLARESLKPALQSPRIRHLRHLWLINGVALTAPADVIRGLASYPGVVSIRTDATMQAPAAIPGTSAAPEWNLNTIRAPELWSLGCTGTGVVVANMDTGVDADHPDLETRWRGGTNSWYDPNGEHATPYDAQGHGTQTMGVILGGDAGGTAIGVAPGARWIAVKIYNDAGQTTFSTIHQAFQWLLDPDENPATTDGADVVNISWALDNVNGCSLEFQSDIDMLKTAGIALAFAAGNYGPYASTSVSPANNSDAFAVGAVDELKNIASLSSRGPAPCDGGVYPEVVAPGINIKTSDLTYGGVIPDAYSVLSGTSFSAPHAAGAMALLISAFPDVTPSDLETALKQSAFDLGSIGPDNTYGYGLIDIVSAYNFIRDLLVSVSPASQAFSNTNLGNVSAVQNFTVTNKTSKDFLIGTVSITGANASEFVRQNDTCSGQTLHASATCTVQVAFSPLSVGTKSATLTIPPGNSSALPLSVSLSGTGVVPQPTLTVTYPNGGESWGQGSTWTITWTYFGDPGPYVTIQLLKGPYAYRTIISRTPIGSNGHGSYAWYFLRKDLFGSDFKIRVSAAADNAITDTSDHAFTITPAFSHYGETTKEVSQ